MNSGKYGIPNESKVNVNFLEYFQSLIEKRNYHRNWTITYKYLQEYSNSEVTFKNVDEGFSSGFLDYLKNVKTKH